MTISKINTKRRYIIYNPGDLVVTRAGTLECLGPSDQKYSNLWKCVCGKEFIAKNSGVKNHSHNSCGCFLKVAKRNNSKDVNLIYLYKLWSRIKEKCYNSKSHRYDDYGGRGIAMYGAWISSSRGFITDILSEIGHRPTHKHQLDRINNDGNYQPGNLRWATNTENCNNKRNTKSKISSAVVKKKQAQVQKSTRPILYSLWSDLKNRCYNIKSKNYDRYGGRGIKFHEAWRCDYELFQKEILESLGLKPSSEYQLDRINNNGNYEPGNLHWVTSKENNRNKSNNVLIEINQEIKTISEWAEISNLHRNVILQRIRKGLKEDVWLAPIQILKFTAEISNKIRQEYYAGAKRSDLAEKYNTSTSTISNIVHYRGGYIRDKNDLVEPSQKGDQSLIEARNGEIRHDSKHMG